MKSPEEGKNILYKCIKENIPITITIGKVKEVRGNVFDIERDNLPELLDVRINAIESDLKQYFSIIPKVGSYVVCGIIEKKEEAILLQCSEVEKVEVKFNENNITVDNKGVSFSLDDGKFDIKNKDEDLKIVISDLIDTINKITVPTPAGVSGMPINALEFNDIKTRLDDLFK